MALSPVAVPVPGWAAAENCLQSLPNHIAERDYLKVLRILCGARQGRKPTLTPRPPLVPRPLPKHTKNSRFFEAWLEYHRYGEVIPHGPAGISVLRGLAFGRGRLEPVRAVILDGVGRDAVEYERGDNSRGDGRQQNSVAKVAGGQDQVGVGPSP
jgi:hypothetical protein